MTNDKQRERLKEILETHCAVAECKAYSQDCTAEDCASCLADYLLANGWMRPPCKVGDKVYFVPRNSGKPIGTVEEHKIVMIGKTVSGFCAKSKLAETTFVNVPHFEIDNYSFFATREEAEAKLVTDTNVGIKKEEGVQG